MWSMRNGIQIRSTNLFLIEISSTLPISIKWYFFGSVGFSPWKPNFLSMGTWYQVVQLPILKWIYLLSCNAEFGGCVMHMDKVSSVSFIVIMNGVKRIYQLTALSTKHVFPLRHVIKTHGFEILREFWYCLIFLSNFWIASITNPR